MKKLLIIAACAMTMAACGSGDTGEGYPADRNGLNPNTMPDNSAVNTAAGDSGNPDSTMGATTPEGAGAGAGSRTKGPDSNATNHNVQGAR